MDFTYMRKAYSLDNESSITQYRDVGGQSRVNMKLSVRLFGRGNVGALRRFISAARGRAVSFMMPTYMHDVPLAEDIQQGATYVDALPQGFSRHMDSPQPVRLMLRFETSSGETYRAIQSVEPVFDDNDNLVAERFYLDEGMPAMAVRDVLRVSYVAPARFDQDAFELVHHVANLRAVSCTLVVRQLYSRRGSI